jgi:hypothetical protein
MIVRATVVSMWTLIMLNSAVIPIWKQVATPESNGV